MGARTCVKPCTGEQGIIWTARGESRNPRFDRITDRNLHHLNAVICYAVSYMPETQIVTAAIIVDTDGRILIAKRPEGKFMPGWWEFPGGKLEFAEPPEMGLEREVLEELGIGIVVGDVFHVVNINRTPDTGVLVMFYWATWTSGEVRLLDAADVAWVRPDEIAGYQFLESNRAVVDKLLKIPSRLR